MLEAYLHGVLQPHQFVWPTFCQTTEKVIQGFEAACWLFGGTFPVAIPDICQV